MNGLPRDVVGDRLADLVEEHLTAHQAGEPVVERSAQKLVLDRSQWCGPRRGTERHRRRRDVRRTECCGRAPRRATSLARTSSQSGSPARRTAFAQFHSAEERARERGGHDAELHGVATRAEQRRGRDLDQRVDQPAEAGDVDGRLSLLVSRLQQDDPLDVPPYPDSPSRLTTPGSTRPAPQPTNAPLSQAGQDDIHSREGHGVRGRPFLPTDYRHCRRAVGCALVPGPRSRTVVDPNVRLLDFVHREGADEGWRLSLGGGDADRIRRCRRPCRIRSGPIPDDVFVVIRGGDRGGADVPHAARHVGARRARRAPPAALRLRTRDS